jgi:hypothetical protein
MKRAPRFDASDPFSFSPRPQRPTKASALDLAQDQTERYDRIVVIGAKVDDQAHFAALRPAHPGLPAVFVPLYKHDITGWFHVRLLEQADA